MIRATALVLSLGAASAFVAPSGKLLVRSASQVANVKMSVDDYLGNPEGNAVFDPLGYSNDAESLYRYRAVELKHGRVAMLAVLGVIVQNFYQLPDPVFSQGSKPIAAALQVWQQRPLAVWQIVIAASLYELTLGRQDLSKPAGDLGFGDIARPEDDETWESVQKKELKNGRLAMVAFTGMQFQEAVTGSGPFELLASGNLNPIGDGVGFF